MNALQIVCPHCKIPMQFIRNAQSKALDAACECGTEYHLYEPNVGYTLVEHNRPNCRKCQDTGEYTDHVVDGMEVIAACDCSAGRAKEITYADNVKTINL